jgi:hypothetical protein
VPSDNFDMSAIGAQSAAVIASLNQAFQTGQPVSREVAADQVAAAAAAPVLPVEPAGVPGTTSFIPRGTSTPVQPQQPAVNPLLAQQPDPAQNPQTQSPINQPALTQTPVPSDAPANTLTDAQVAAINDQAVYSVPMQDGTNASMTGLELRQSIMRHRNYTQKTQELAEARRSLEPVATENQTLRTQMSALQADLQNPQAVAQYILQRFGPQFFQQYAGGVPQAQPAAVAQPGYNPEAVATLGEVQQFVAQALAQVPQNPQVDLAAIEQAATQKALATIQQVQQAQAINNVLPKILEANPAIAAIPFWEQTLRYNVLQKYPTPQNAKQAVAAFAAEARLLDQHVRQNWAMINKQNAVNQQRLQTNNTLPPGGATPVVNSAPAGPRTYVDPATGQPQWGAFSQDLTAWMTQRMAGH